MSLLFIEKLPAPIRPAFANKLQKIAAALEINPDWLMQVMWAESRLEPKAANRQGKDRHLVAAGLLQFTEGSGIVKAGKVPSIAHILNRSALEQLDLVHWYFKPFKGRLKSYFDVYAVTFFPAMIGKPDDWVLQTKTLSATTVALQNKVIAKGKSFITVADFKRYVRDVVPLSIRERIFGAVVQAVDATEAEAGKISASIKNHPNESAAVGTGVIVGLCLLGWFFLKTR